MTFSSLVINLLEESIERLKNDLSCLEPMLEQHKEGMFITHDGENSIHVHCSLRFRAYIPKKYDGWPVKIFDWDPNGDLLLDLDYSVNL